MPTSYHKFSGPCKWAKVHRPDDKYNVYSIQVYLDQEQQAKLKDTGIQIQPKEDIDGVYYTFRRPVVKVIKGKLVELGPPKVNTEKIVGNGSTVTVDISVYDTIKGKGHTLNEVKVTNLVEYVPDSND